MTKERSKSSSKVHKNQDDDQDTGPVMMSRFNIQISKPTQINFNLFAQIVVGFVLTCFKTFENIV